MRSALTAILVLLAVTATGAVTYDIWTRYQRYIVHEIDTVDQPSVVREQTDGSQLPPIDAIKAARLFGQPADVQPVSANVPETRLQLVLYGVVATARTEAGIALIGQENSMGQPYSIGDMVQNTDAIVREVEPVRVILDRGGQLESLELKRATLILNAP